MPSMECIKYARYVRRTMFKCTARVDQIQTEMENASELSIHLCMFDEKKRTHRPLRCRQRLEMAHFTMIAMGRTVHIHTENPHIQSFELVRRTSVDAMRCIRQRPSHATTASIQFRPEIIAWLFSFALIENKGRTFCATIKK